MFFASAAAAEWAEFRALFRCRAELALGLANVDSPPRLEWTSGAPSRRDVDVSATAFATIETPIGPLELIATSAALTGVHFSGRAPTGASTAAVTAAEHPVLSLAARELTEYFAGDRQHFTVPLSLPLSGGGTPFQRHVWQLLAEIPYSATWSYADLARAAGRPRAVRAVGAANGKNPHSIIVPCHRVIQTGGQLGGYGGGLERKRWLLAHEGAVPSLPGLLP